VKRGFALPSYFSRVVFLPRPARSASSLGLCGDDHPATFSKDVAPIFSALRELPPARRNSAHVVADWEHAPGLQIVRQKVVVKDAAIASQIRIMASFVMTARLSEEIERSSQAGSAGGGSEGNRDLPLLRYRFGLNIGQPDQAFSIPEQNVPADECDISTLRSRRTSLKTTG
jgi:hypothetical protein